MNLQTDVLPPRWLDLTTRGHLPYSIILGGGVVLHALNIFISTTILPSIVRDIGGLDYYAWSTTLFVVASIVSAALTSRLKAALGARNAYLLALLLFAFGTVLCGAAGSITVLNIGRTVQGAGGGLLYALAYTVIRSVFPERLWPIAIGLITMMFGISTLLGPALGGFFAEIGHWRMAFFALLPVVVAIALLSAVKLDNSRQAGERPAPVPVVQLALLIGVVLVVSLASAQPEAWRLAAAGVTSLVFAATAFWVETRSNGRLLPRGALDPFSELGALYLCIAFLLIGMQPETFIPFFLQTLYGQSPLVAGYIGALMALGWTVGSAVSAGFTGTRARNTILQGAGLSFCGLLVQLFLLPAGGGPAALGAVCLGLMLVGFGIGFCWPHLTTQIYKSSPTGEADLAAGAITTVQMFATALGAALVGLTVNTAGLVDPGGPEGISAAAFWMCLLFLLAPAAAAFFANQFLKRNSERSFDQ